MESKELSTTTIESRIFTFRGKEIMVDRDLAELYQVETKRLNEQVKRNVDRFPDSFRFQLNEKELSELIANCDRFEKLKHSTSKPYAFTEQGIAMLSAVLRSDVAVQVSVQIMQADPDETLNLMIASKDFMSNLLESAGFSVDNSSGNNKGNENARNKPAVNQSGDEINKKGTLDKNSF